MPDEYEKDFLEVDASCSSPTPLTQKSPNTLNASVCHPRKRKPSTGDDDGPWLGGSITIHPHPSQHGELRVLQPSRLIDRSMLPLAYLPPLEHQGPTLFSAHIWLLEMDGSDGDHKILLTHCLKDGRYFAIERVGRYVYALCALAKWVSLEDIGRTPVKIPRVRQQALQDETGENVWWRAARVIDTPKSTPKPTSRRDFILRIKPQPETKCAPDLATFPPLGASEDGAKVTAPKPSIVRPSLAQATKMLQVNAIGDLQAQYLEALYVSKAPLAYFVKGPLSRARAANDSSDIPQEGKSNLLEVLQSSILPVKERGGSARVDKKYSASVPELIKEIPPSSNAEDEEGQLISVFGERYKRSKKRKKINPDGFFPGEESHIVKWWLQREAANPESGVEDSQERRVRSACSTQKPRELQLQIVLILELMGLLGQKKIQPADEDEATQSVLTESKSKKEKSSLDYSKILDVMLEKLQIWETTNQFALDRGSSLSKAELNDKKKQPETSAEDDCLRSFCTEVIIPFYAPRLPDLSKSICQKLGVAIPSPPKKSLVRSSSSTKPGAPVRSRRPLARVLTEDTTAPRKLPPSLLRSTTDTSLPFIKQEFGSTTLSRKSTPQPNLQQTHRYSQREVDLHAEVKATEAKLKRKQAIEQEIQGAINTLKRPNARLAVQEFVDASDQRHTSNKKPGKSRKSQNPVFNPFALGGVQVMATPKAIRQKYIKTLTRAQSEHLPAVPEFPIDPEPQIIPPSSDPRIPSSSARPRATPTLSRSQSQVVSSTSANHLNGTLRRSSSQISITATPSRPRTANHLSQPSSRLASMLDLSDNEYDNEEDEILTLPKLPEFKKSSVGGRVDSGGNGGGTDFKRPSLPKVRQTPVKTRPAKEDGATFLTPQKPRSQVVDTVRLSGADGDLVSVTPVKSIVETEIVREVVAESSPSRSRGDMEMTAGENDEVEHEETVADSVLQVDRGCESKGCRDAEGDRGDGDVYAALGWDGEGVDLL